jgi:alpha-glucosidase
MRFWLDMGVDGFRLDVFNAYFKDRELRSNPRRLHPMAPFVRYFRQEHVYDRDRPEMAEALREMRALVDSYGDRCMVGETLDELFRYRLAHRYYGEGDQLHMVFNFELLHEKWSPRRFQDSIRSWLEAVPAGCWPTWVVSNHDFPRERSHYGGRGDERSKLIALIITALKGTPFIYYGQEIGMTEQRIPRARIVDPVGKRFWPVLKGRDGCRTPMQWSAEPGAGFSSGQSWLPLGQDYRERNVEAQRSDPRSLWSVYHRLLELRREHQALAVGDIEMPARQPSWGLTWRRLHDDDSYRVVINMTSAHQHYSLPPGHQLVFSTHQRGDGIIEHLEPYEGLIAGAT